MADMPTIIETGKNNDNGWGGNAWGAGVGGFIGSLFGNGGFGGWGWGGNGRDGQVGADVALGNAIQNVQNAVQANGLSQLQSANGIQQGIAGAAAGVTAGVTQNTIANLQGFAGMGQQICCSTGRLSQEIDTAGDQTVAAINAGTIQGMQNTQLMSDRLCATNQNILNQGYEGRLQNQSLAAQLAAQHADLKATIQQENCQDRELMRQIADQQVRDKLAEAQAKIVQLETQNYVNQSNSQQTLYLIDQLKTTTTAAAGA